MCFCEQKTFNVYFKNLALKKYKFVDSEWVDKIT